MRLRRTQITRLLGPAILCWIGIHPILSAATQRPLNLSDSNNFFRFQSQGGPTFVLNSVDLSRHFFDQDNDESNVFVQHRFEANGHTRPEQALPAKWDLGFSHGLFFFSFPQENTSFTDQLLSGRLGLHVDLSYGLQLDVQVSADSISAEQYQHGKIAIQFAKIFPLTKTPPTLEDEEDDNVDEPDDLATIADYYKTQRAQDMKELEVERNRTLAQIANAEDKDADDDLDDDEDENEDDDSDDSSLNDNSAIPKLFPQIRIGIHSAVDTHTLSAKTFSRRPQLGTLAQAMDLSQYTYGFEINYSPRSHITWTALADAVFYFSVVDPFVAGFEPSNNIQTIGQSLGPDHFLSFASVILGGQLKYQPHPSSQFHLEILYSTFQTINTNSLVWVHPQYAVLLAPQWKLEVGGALAAPQPTLIGFGSISLDYIF